MEQQSGPMKLFMRASKDGLGGGNTGECIRSRRQKAIGAQQQMCPRTEEVDPDRLDIDLIPRSGMKSPRTEQGKILADKRSKKKREGTREIWGNKDWGPESRPDRSRTAIHEAARKGIGRSKKGKIPSQRNPKKRI